MQPLIRLDSHCAVSPARGSLPELQAPFWETKSIKLLGFLPLSFLHSAKRHQVKETRSRLPDGGRTRTQGREEGDILASHLGSCAPSLTGVCRTSPDWVAERERERERVHSHEHPPQGTIQIKLTFFPFSLYCKQIEDCCTKICLPHGFHSPCFSAWVSRAGLARSREMDLRPPSRVSETLPF